MRSEVQTILRDEKDQGLLINIAVATMSPRRRTELRSAQFFDFIHPMGAVPKLDGTKRVGTRVIQDYSFPRGNAVNDRIDYLPVQFDKLDAAVHYISAYPKCCAAKVDISGFFRNLPIDPTDWPLLVAAWDFGSGPELLIDTRMPFGLRHAPEVCCRFTATVLHTIKSKIAEVGISWATEVLVLNVVDDWLVLSPRTEVCDRVWSILKALLLKLGFQLNLRKSVGPRQEIGWLGLLLRTNPSSGPPTVELPPDKLSKGRELLQSFMQKFEPKMNGS